MLPKPDKTKKPLNPEQLPLPEKKPKKEPKVKDVKTKRFILILILFLTVGLSIIFSLYHYFQIYPLTFSPRIPRFNLTNLSVLPSPELDNEIDSIIGPDKSYWSVYLNSNDFTWSKNADQLFADISQPEIISQLNSSPQNDADINWLGLPQGLHLRKIDTAPSGYYRVGYQIITPQKNINIVIKISGTDFKKSINLIPRVVSAVYWKLI